MSITPWGGSFILEASTTGEDGTWVPMVASSDSGTCLGREGLVAGGIGLTGSGYNAFAFTNKIFTISKPNTYIPPSGVSGPNLISGELRQDSSASCSVLSMQMVVVGIKIQMKQVTLVFTVCEQINRHLTGRLVVNSTV